MDETIVKPTPGRKKSMPSSTVAVGESDNTILLTQMIQEDKESSVIAYGSNMLLAEANIIFSLLGQIRSTAVHSDVKQLREVFVQKMRDYENRLRQQGADAKKIDIARYCLCCVIDEAVLNTTWGSQSVWVHNSLLSTFYSNTQGGEEFFVHLNECINHSQQSMDLLEVMYLCMSLGFKGYFRIKENGDEQHRSLKIKVMDILKNNNRVSESTLNESSAKNVLIGQKMTDKVPLWVVLSITAAFLTSIYMYFSFNLNDKSNVTFSNLINLLPEREIQRQQDSSVSSFVVSEQIKRFLATEIEMNILQVEALTDRVRISFQSQDLFQSGSAEMVAHIQPVIAKVSRALEATSGKVLVIGHTDNNPIFTSKFPSNWHLSLARATSLTDSLMSHGTLKGRVIPEGRGDARPLVSNDTPEGRKMNRRVEIDLLVPDQFMNGN